LSVLKSSEYAYVEKVFEFIEKEIKITLFAQVPESQASRETREILEELSSFSDKISLRVLDFENQKDVASTYGVDKLPGTVIEGEKDYGIRYFGAPSGYLVSSVIEDIIQISKVVPELKSETKKIISELKAPLNLQVFTSATSPYCPALVNLTHKLAMQNDNISAHMIDVKEFPHLSMRYHITDVPSTVVNNSVTVDGALDEKDFVNKMIEAIK
jgi:glutaredoxin-like protein